MILSGKSIKVFIKNKKLVIKPRPKIKEAAIKLHLGGEFGKSEESFDASKQYLLKPKEFVLGKTLEKIQLPLNLLGLYDSYVKIANKGVISHLGSMMIDPGFSGQITLEIFNTSDKQITLKEGTRIGHLILFEVK